MEEVLYIEIKRKNTLEVELRFWFKDETQYQSVSRSLVSLESIKSLAEQYYHRNLDIELKIIGQQLYRWFDGGDSFFSLMIRSARKAMQGQYLILAIDTDEQLAHIPWEVLHDDIGFLVQQRRPTIVPLRWKKDGSEIVLAPENRPLRVLFMATQPKDLMVLNFEEEEKLILDATKKQKINLAVEESGNLQDLKDLISEYGDSCRFDVFHMNGHATINQSGIPVFYTETEIGEPHLADAVEIWDALIAVPPRVVFLSGCYTGAMGDKGQIASLAQQLIEQGAKSVLGWGRPVRDDHAMEAAAILYGALAVGQSLTFALSQTYQQMIARKMDNWHLLRLFVAGRLNGPLVTQPRRPDRIDINFPINGSTYLNQTEKKQEVADYKSFVGRRRELQSAIKTLKYDECTGILLWGMGGVGKSSLANRIIFRLKDVFKPILLTYRYDNLLDIPKIRNFLAEDISEESLRHQLHLRQAESNVMPARISMNADSFYYTLRDVLRNTKDRILFLIDDFEGNFQKHSDGSILLSEYQTPQIMPEALEALKALSRAIANAKDKGHRVLITSRYNIDPSLVEDIKQIEINRLDSSDIYKKFQRLERQQMIGENERDQIIKGSDGNPRLLEWLFQNRSSLDKETDRFRGDIYIKQILRQLTTEQREIMGRIALFEIPIPHYIASNICEDLDFERNIPKIISLGILEGYEGRDSEYAIAQFITQDLPTPNPKIVHRAASLACELWITSTTYQSGEYSSLQEKRNQEVYRLSRKAKAIEPLVSSTKALCKSWLDIGKNYGEVIRICKEALSLQPDYKIYQYLSTAMFETGELYETSTDELDGFVVLEKANQICPVDNIEDQIELNILSSFWYRDYGNSNKALEFAQQAESLSKVFEYNIVRVSALHQLACVMSDMGDYNKSEKLFEEALEKSIQLHQTSEMQNLIIRTEKASLLYWRDFKKTTLNELGVFGETFHEFGALLNYAMVNSILAGLYIHLKQWKQAEKVVTIAMDLFKKIGSKRGIAYVFVQQGQIFAAKDKAGLAIEKFEEGIEIGEELNNSGILYFAHQTMGQFRFGRQEFDLAKIHYDEIFKLAEVTENFFWLNEYLVLMAQINIAKKHDVEKTLNLCIERLDNVITLNHPVHAISLFNTIGDLYLELEMYEKSKIYYQKALDIKDYPNIPILSYSKYRLGQVFEVLGKYEEALLYYSDSLDHYRLINDLESQVTILDIISNAKVKQSYPEEALTYIEESNRIRQEINWDPLQGMLNKLKIENQIGRLPSLELIEEVERHILKTLHINDRIFALDQIALYRLKLRHFEEARAVWEKMHNDILDEYKENELITAFAKFKYAYMLGVNNRINEAKHFINKSCVIFRTRLGGAHEIVRSIEQMEHVSGQQIIDIMAKWCLMPLSEIFNQPLPDKSAEVLRLLVGIDIVDVFDPDTGSQILDRIGQMRMDILDTEDFLLPNIRIMDDSSLPKKDYVLTLNGREIYRGKLPTLYAIQDISKSTFFSKSTMEIGFSKPLRWLKEVDKIPDDSILYSAEDVVLVNLKAMIIQSKDSILAEIQ
jgi:tetratricopeptide (TPR) repeat protein/GTPase SAR1 family protein